MPSFRSGPFIEEAVTSILSQTFADLELIIVCDEATEELKNILARYARSDSRVLVVHNPDRLGLVGSRNLAIRLAKGEFINPMDSDDVSHSERLERQIHFLEHHPETGLLGTGFEYIDGQGNRVRNVEGILQPLALKWALFFENPFCQSSVVIRRSVLDLVGWYDNSRPLAEDYDLWIRMAELNTVRMLPDVLMQYRVHDNNISSFERTTLNRDSSDINRDLFRRYYNGVTDDDITAFQYLLFRRDFPSKLDVARASRLIRFMFQEFVKREKLSTQEQDEIRRHLGYQYLILAYLSKNVSPLWSFKFFITGFHLRRSLPIDLLRLLARRVRV